MTCIVGIIDKENNNVLIAGDSAGVKGLNIKVRKDPKVFRVGNFVIGCTTSFRMIQLLRFSFVPPDIDEKDIYDYMCTDFVKAIRKTFKKGGYLKKYDNGDEGGGNFLVGFQDRLFSIEDDFQVEEHERNYNAVGCGEEFALGSFTTTEGMDMAPEERAVMALQTAVQNSGGVRPPFVLEYTKT